jgi:hypothetical protein
LRQKVEIVRKFDVFGDDSNLGAVDESFRPISGVKLYSKLFRVAFLDHSVVKISGQIAVGCIIFDVSRWITRVCRKLDTR